MSFVSKLADYLRGEFEITCFSDPELESSFQRERECYRERLAQRDNFVQEEDMFRSKNGQEIKPKAIPPKSMKKNKLVEYIKGETDILCFAPIPEDFSSASRGHWGGDLGLSKSDDEDDDLIHIDIRDKSHSEKLERFSGDVMKGLTASTGSYSSCDYHTNIKASSSKQIPTNNSLNHIPLSTEFNASFRSIRKDSSTTSKESTRYPTNVIQVTKSSSRIDLLPSDHHTIKAYPRHYNRTDYQPYGEERTGKALDKLSLDTISQDIGLMAVRPSPTNVITGFSNYSAATQEDRSEIEFLKELYNRENRNSTSNLLDLDDAESLMNEKILSSRRNFNFESAGFSKEEASMIKRRIKLQNLVRSVKSGLSD